ncbi:MAG: MFS transporter [Dehalococcoidales bacterium]
MSLGAFAASLDNNVLNVALPAIIRDLEIDAGTGQFIVSSYTFAIVALLLIFGALSINFGRKRVFAIGTLIFSLSSLVAALAPNELILVASRIIQGMGAAMFMANGMALVSSNFEKNNWGKAFGILATAGAIASIVGPLVGSAIASFWNWRFIFLLVVILGLLASVTANKLLEDHPAGDYKTALTRFDYKGSLLSIVAVIILVSSFSFLSSNSWFLFALLLVLFFIIGKIFISHQLRTRNALLPVQAIKNKSFLQGNTMAMIVFALMMGIGIILPLHLDNAFTSTLITAGFLITLQAIPIFAFSFVAGFLADKYSANNVAFGGCSAIFLGITLLATALHFELTILMAIASIIVGIGIGLFNPSNNKVVMSCVEIKYSSIAASVNVLFRNIGIALGTALAGILYSFFQASLIASVLSPGTAALLFYVGLSLILLIMGAIRIIHQKRYNAGSPSFSPTINANLKR